MVKQLDLSTFFMALSCDDLHWNELILTIAKLNGENLLEENINSMDFFQRCNYLNINSILLSRQFQHSVEAFFKLIVVGGSLGKVKYHVIRVELQKRRTPHFCSLLWILNAPLLCNTNIDVCINFVDSENKGSRFEFDC